MSRWVMIVASGLTTFIISAGGCLLSAMAATGSTAIPSVSALVFSGVTGLVAAAKGTQDLLTHPPPP